MTDSLDIVEASPAFISELVKKRRPNLWRMDGQGFRFYYELGGPRIIFRASWTSAIGDQLGFPIGLLDWYLKHGKKEAERLRDERAHYGSCLHLVLAYFAETRRIKPSGIENIILSYAAKKGLAEAATLADWRHDMMSDTLAFAQFINDKNVVPIAIEIPLVSEHYNLAGTIDMICEMDFNKKRVIAVVDIKSGRKGFYESHAIQLAAYQAMWNENFPELQATMCFNWSPKEWTKTPTYNLVNQTENGSALKLDSLVRMFFIDHPCPEPKPVRQFTGDITFGMDLTGIYRDVDIQEYLQAKHSDYYSSLEADAASNKQQLLSADF